MFPHGIWYVIALYFSISFLSKLFGLLVRRNEVHDSLLCKYVLIVTVCAYKYQSLPNISVSLILFFSSQIVDLSTLYVNFLHRRSLPSLLSKVPEFSLYVLGNHFQNEDAHANVPAMIATRYDHVEWACVLLYIWISKIHYVIRPYMKKSSLQLRSML